MSIVNDLRVAAACWPQDWPPQDGALWEIPRSFLRWDECFGDLTDNMPWFLLMVAETLHPSLPVNDLRRVARYLKSDNDDDSWLPYGEWQRLAAMLDDLARAA